MRVYSQDGCGDEPRSWLVTRCVAHSISAIAPRNPCPGAPYHPLPGNRLWQAAPAGLRAVARHGACFRKAHDPQTRDTVRVDVQDMRMHDHVPDTEQFPASGIRSSYHNPPYQVNVKTLVSYMNRDGFFNTQASIKTPLRQHKPSTSYLESPC